MLSEATVSIAYIDHLLAEGDDIWEAAVSIGQSNEKHMTAARWLQGDLALRVEKSYGEDFLGKFATAIDVNHSTLKQRRQISAFYPEDTRYQYENLVYSHYRTAMQLGDRALWALSKASTRDWPAWKFELLIKRLQGKHEPTGKTTTGQITRTYTQEDGNYAVVRIPPESDLKTGQTVTLKVKE